MERPSLKSSKLQKYLRKYRSLIIIKIGFVKVLKVSKELEKYYLSIYHREKFQGLKADG